MDINKIISEMTLEQKIDFCTGADFWHTKDTLGVPVIKMADGPHGPPTCWALTYLSQPHVSPLP